MRKFVILLFTFLMTLMQTYAKDIRFVQVDGVMYVPSENKLSEIVEKINKEKNVEFVVFTGNNISKSDSAYLKGFLKTAKKLKCPFYIALGNKDVNRQKGLSKKEYIKIVRGYAISLNRISGPNYAFKKGDVK